MNMLDQKLFRGHLSEILGVLSYRGVFVSNLVHFVTVFGACLGAYPHVFWRDKIYANLNAVIVGGPASGKGESLKVITDLFRADRHAQELLAVFSKETFTSGKDCIKHIDASLSYDDGETRFLHITTEFSKQLRAMVISTNTLTTHLINLSDGDTISATVGNQRITLEDVHFASINLITPGAFRAKLTYDLIDGGYASRLLIVNLPEPEYQIEPMEIPHEALASIKKLMFGSLRSGGERQEVEMEEAAKERYKIFLAQHFSNMGSDEKIKNLTKRFDLHCLKIALTIALINQEEKISLDTMEAACALMDYSRAFIDDLFGSSPAFIQRDKILGFVTQRGEATKTEITKAFAAKLSVDEQNELLDSLVADNKLIKSETKKARGRKSIIYSLPA